MLKDFLDWLERVLPGWFAAFGIGYKLGNRGLTKAKIDLDEAKLELEIEKNHEKIDHDNAGVNDSDGVDKIAGPK